MPSIDDELTTELIEPGGVFIDDDLDNIELALQDSVRGILLDPDRSHLLIGDILARYAMMDYSIVQRFEHG